MQIKHRYLKAILALASRDETRFALNGIHIEPVKEGNLLVATDGRRLGALYVQGEPVKTPFILPAWAMEFIPSRIYKLEITLAGTKVTIQSTRSNEMPDMICDAIDATFPKWRQVVPTAGFTPAQINIDSKVLEPFLKCAKILSPESPYIHFRTIDELSAISIFLENKDFFGVIMPIRETASSKEIPAWAKL